jgi:branched-chain amino acid transport system ATP-binding protein
VIKRIHAEGVSILLIEQNAAKALAIAGRGYVMEDGRTVTQGQAADLLSQPHIREAYLGETREE